MKTIGNLLNIKIFDGVTGTTFNLLGFKSKGLDTSGYHITEVDLYDPSRKTIGTVKGLALKRLSIVEEN